MSQPVIKTIRYVQSDETLWEEPMIFKRLFAVGDPVCQDATWYKVQQVMIDNDVQIVTLVPE